MKTLLLFVVAVLFAHSSFAQASKAAVEHLSDARCFDIKQSVLADLPHFCGSAQTDNVRLSDFGHQIDLLAKNCEQPQLAHLLKKALAEHVNKNKQGCTAAAEKMVLPAMAKATAAAQSDDL